jgi:hypothetical protein
VLRKLEYYHGSGSERHLRDIREMLRISGVHADVAAIENWAKKLDIMETWRLVRPAATD